MLTRGPCGAAACACRYFFSDSWGREASLSEVLGAEAYVLFYERITSSPT